KKGCTKKVFTLRGSGGSLCKNSHKIIGLHIVSEYNYWTQDIVFGRFFYQLKYFPFFLLIL
ncbi:hypothetical protein KBB89_03530, partial [Candidatus Gracilibacteria bacterium]|nr:hypothetical protein [Candidatus Gracilibacteria bacterium]